MLRRYVCATSLAVVMTGSGMLFGSEADKPPYGSWGFDTSALDRAVKPGDDFFRYADGAWIDRVEIPPDKSLITRRLEMTDRTEARLHEILESAAASADVRPVDLQGKVGAFYKSFMDAATVDHLGVRAVETQLAAVRAAASRGALAALMGRSNVDFESSIFNVLIDVDYKNPKRYAVYLQQSGLGLPDRDYYLEPSFEAKKAAYRGYVEKLLTLAGWPRPSSSASEVVDFETQIARVSWSRAQDRDVEATYNPMTLVELEKASPGFDWQAFVSAAGISSQPLVVAEKSAFPKLAARYAQTPLPTLKAWEVFHILDDAAPYLSSAFSDAWYQMHEQLLAGQKAQRPRWKRAITAVGGGDFGVGEHFGTFGTLGYAVGRLYVAKYFPPSSKAQVEELVRNLIIAYRARLGHLDWMSASTRAEAIKKLETYTIKIGYPDDAPPTAPPAAARQASTSPTRDYSHLTINADDLAGNVRRAATLDWTFLVERSLGPVDRASWDMTPQTNDAYNGSLRDIAFPAGILQPPVFDPKADPAVNYGAVGAIIGHELTHGFDDEGRKIDADGAIRDWWDPKDDAAFDARAARLGRQYASYRPIAGDPKVTINGELTMGENIADLGGLSLALDAYRLSLRGAPAPLLDGFTGEQRVFLGWAQAWGGKAADDYVRRQVVNDPHSPRQFRVNGVVRNIDAWYQAFDVRPGNALYLPPEARVRIW